MKKFRKAAAVSLSACMMVSALAGCGGETATTAAASHTP